MERVKREKHVLRSKAKPLETANGCGDAEDGCRALAALKRQIGTRKWFALLRHGCLEGCQPSRANASFVPRQPGGLVMTC